MGEFIEEIVIESVDEFGDVFSEPYVEVIEDSIPEEYRLITHTNYSTLKKLIVTFMNSKRHTRDIENNDSFIGGGSKCGCARVDAVYSVRPGLKSHITVQDKDQYWAEQEKMFPHLKQLHENETAAVEKLQEYFYNEKSVLPPDLDDSAKSPFCCVDEKNYYEKSLD